MIFEKIGQKLVENMGIFNFDEMGFVDLLGGVVEMRKATVPKDFDTVAGRGIYEVKLGVGGKSPYTPIAVDAIICCKL